MKADLHLSRPCYRAGSPVVGTARIHRDHPKSSGVASAYNDDRSQSSERPIREEIVSARVYLSGRAYIGGGAGKVSRWRSMQEINQLKNMYGDHHACLTMAVDDERCNWNGAWKNGGGGGGTNDEQHGSIGIEKASSSKRNSKSANATFRKKTPSPSLSHVEQAERLAVYSCLRHNSSPTMTMQDGNSNGNSNVSNDSNMQKSLSGGNDYSNLPSPHDSNVICFWMTNVLELLDVPERHLDRNCDNNCKLRPDRGKYYGDMDPYRPLQLPDSIVLRDVWHEIEDRGKIKGANKKSLSMMNRREQNTALSPQTAWEQIIASANPRKESSKDDDPSLEHVQLVVTFRTDLPSDAPPTMSTECVKYFYSAVLVVTTANGELLIGHCQFTVLTSNLQLAHQTSPTRVHIGDLHAIAHSVALPTFISSTEVSDASPPQLNIVSNSPACDIVSRRTAEQRTSTHRIQDCDGCYCASMTLIGIGQGSLVPGTRLGLRVQFPICEGDECSQGTGIIPCHRVCCALVGEEYAVFEGSSTTNGSSKKRVKTRSYVFDYAYDLVHFGYTEAISLGLVLPLDCPVTVKTDLIEVTVTLMVEFTVGSSTIGVFDKETQSGDQGEFKVIRLDLPCEVIHGDVLLSLENRDEEGERHVSSRRTLQLFWNNDNTETNDEGLDDIDIQPDLKLLSLRLKECI